MAYIITFNVVKTQSEEKKTEPSNAWVLGSHALIFAWSQIVCVRLLISVGAVNDKQLGCLSIEHILWMEVAIRTEWWRRKCKRTAMIDGVCKCRNIERRIESEG